MVLVNLLCYREIAFSLLGISQAVMPKCHHIVAMHFVAYVQVFVPDEQVRKRNCSHLVEEMLFTKCEQFVKTASGFVNATEALQCHTLIEDFIRFGIVVI